ncbi:MarR family transcriptional regulator [Ramlibacter sp. AW1]|uniref:MarR family transcriptional regulator n=1 Tax=Ramlibacter aurantiacus TaxID=2801330 RepID=A0A936ZE25_9BURK|nr:MarR family transcriptional regulator [Ramlibacter aurantiacus]MBL0419232.1 MarR family transcriptional regulator [Ramlibacter aurantiacus]
MSVIPASKRRKAAPSPAHFVDDYLPALLAQASHLISGEFHRVVTQKGFTVSEWRVLATLAGRRQMSIGQLARMTVMKQPTLTRVLDRMEARGDVQRLPHETDRRITLVTITRSGERLVAGLIELAQEHERRVLEPFGLGRSAELKTTLKQMIEMHQLAAGEESSGEDDDA